MSQLDWGSVPVWFGALVTSTSAALAVISYRRNLYDKEREQASKVSCWVVGGWIRSVEKSSDDLYSADVSISIKVANRSDSSVYDVEVILPGRNGETLRGMELPPGVTGTGNMRLRDTYLDKNPPEVNQIDARITIGNPTLTFTDALGRRWCKSKERIRRIRQKAQLRAVLLKPGSRPSDLGDVEWTATGR